MSNNYFSAAFRRCIDCLLRTVDDDPDFPTAESLPPQPIANPTLLQAAVRIQRDFPDDFIGDDVKRIEEKLRSGRPSLRTKYWKQIIEAAMDDDLGLGRPLPNYAVGPMGYNPLAHAIKKGAQLVVSVPIQYEIDPATKVEAEAKPDSLSIIQLTLIWITVVLCVRAIKFLSNS
ncbi:MAG: hypothetical protein D4R39_00735 [Methylophilaceae bacterium]|nr:MAG: hypothetical protein D4R39_00735 [Methylophilaceae bacterium]